MPSLNHALSTTSYIICRMPIGIGKHAVQIIDKTDTFTIIWINDVVVNAKIIKNRNKRERVCLQLKIWMPNPLLNVSPSPSEEIVESNHFVAVSHQIVDQM